MNIERKGDLWFLTDSASEEEIELFLDSEEIEILLDSDVVAELINMLNKASCDGADWPIYDISDR